MLTDNYIKMCEKAEQIQADFKFGMGDWYIENYNTEDQHIIVLDQGIVSRLVQNIILKKYGAIWLPTQEQLQEMLTDKLFHIWGRFDYLFRTASNCVSTCSKTKIFAGNRDSHQVCKKVNSMNELWLAFVMKEKYNKIWTGEKWEAVKE